MSANSVDSDQYVDGSIDTVHLADDVVTGDKLANNIDIAGTLDVTGLLTADANVVIAGDLTVNGTTTTLNTATLDVEDKNITINYGAGDTSGSANGAGITIQDAIDASNDATILWDTTNDEFDFSHAINVTGAITASGAITGTLATAAQTNITSVGTLSALTVTGEITANGGIALGDNDKATFGASDDLQIYHLTNTYLENYTGNLNITNNSNDKNIQLSTDNGSGGTTSYILINGNEGTVNLSYYGSQKLITTSTGIDVTGTATMDGLTVDGDVSFDTNNAANPVVISRFGNTNESLSISINDSMTSFVSEQDETDTTRYGGFEFIGRHAGTNRTRFKIDHTTGDISFYNAAGTSQALFWDASAESLGIGTTSPSSALEVVSGASLGSGFTQSRSGHPTFGITNGGTDSLYFSLAPNGGSHQTFMQVRDDDTDVSSVAFSTSGSEAMRLDSSGRLGIGTTSPSSALHIKTSVDNSLSQGLVIERSANTDKGYINYQGGAFQIRATDGDPIAFGQVSNERARIDSSGNLLVGTTDSNVYNDATGTGTVIQSNGIMQLAANGGTPLYANRQGTDGDIIDFRKNGTSVGSIGSHAGIYTYIGTDDTALLFAGNIDAVMPFSPSASNYRDNAIDLGTSSYRFDDIYATNGTIQTSDRNEKQDIAELSDAETRVAVAAKGLLRKFRWQSAVEEKGDNARTHFGIIAQDLQDAFTAEGLDAGDYAMFISSTWTDDDGVEQTRLGVRYSELLAFIIAAI